jgi:hypothetical protein
MNTEFSSTEEQEQAQLADQAQNGLDISAEVEANKAEDEGTDVHLNGRDGKPMFYQGSPVVIRVAGNNSQRCRRFEHQLRQRKLRPKDFVGQRFYDDGIEKAAFCTLSWQGIVDNGNPVQCNVRNAAELYKRIGWVYDQVLEAMSDAERFINRSSTPQ